MPKANEKVSKRYARALFSAVKADEYDQVESFLNKLARIWESNAELRQVILSPSVNLKEQTDLFSAIFDRLGKDIPTSIRKGLQLMLNNRRAESFPGVAKFFSQYVKEYKQMLALKITSARNLSEDEQRGILETLRNKLGREVTVDWDVEPDQIGGLKIKVGDKLLDRSVSGVLNELRNHVVV